MAKWALVFALLCSCQLVDMVDPPPKDVSPITPIPRPSGEAEPPPRPPGPPTPPAPTPLAAADAGPEAPPNPPPTADDLKGAVFIEVTASNAQGGRSVTRIAGTPAQAKATVVQLSGRGDPSLRRGAVPGDALRKLLDKLQKAKWWELKSVSPDEAGAPLTRVTIRRGLTEQRFSLPEPCRCVQGEVAGAIRSAGAAATKAAPKPKAAQALAYRPPKPSGKPIPAECQWDGQRHTCRNSSRTYRFCFASGKGGLCVDDPFQKSSVPVTPKKPLAAPKGKGEVVPIALELDSGARCVVGAAQGYACADGSRVVETAGNGPVRLARVARDDDEDWAAVVRVWR